MPHNGTLVLLWECKIVQTLWENVLVSFKSKSPTSPTCAITSHLGVYPKETQTCVHTLSLVTSIMFDGQWYKYQIFFN